MQKKPFRMQGDVSLRERVFSIFTSQAFKPLGSSLDALPSSVYFCADSEMHAGPAPDASTRVEMMQQRGQAA